MAVFPSAVAAAITAAGEGGAGTGPGRGMTCGGGGGGGSGAGGGTGQGALIIFAQVAVTAALLTMPAPCWRATALCMAVPSVSSITMSSMLKDCAGPWATSRVEAALTLSTIWLLTVFSLLMTERLPSG